jgi:hypothetical protein
MAVTLFKQPFRIVIPDPDPGLPDPDPLVRCMDSDPDPHVFEPPGSGFFYHQAKIVRKTLIPSVL